MKKKLLSLVLAGAMVASTSVSAFAATEKPVTVGNGEVDHKVTVTGNVTNGSDEVLPGTISVTIPTAVSFRVNSEGDVDSAEINITSDSDESVDVIAYKFIDPSTEKNITVVPEGELTAKDNTQSNRYVSLRIKGGTQDVALKSGGTTTGILKDNDSEYSLTDKPVVGTVTKSNSLSLRIEGKAAQGTSGRYEAPSDPIRDDFKLILKIQKSKSQSQ